MVAYDWNKHLLSSLKITEMDTNRRALATAKYSFWERKQRTKTNLTNCVPRYIEMLIVHNVILEP